MATLYYPNNDCGTIQFAAYSCSNCLTRELASVRSLAFVSESIAATFDYSSPSHWATAIANQTAFVYWRTKGEYDGGETEEIDGYGDSATDNGGTTHSITVFDPYVLNNVDHWNYIKSRSDLIPVIRTKTRIWVFEEPGNIKVKMPIANDKKAVIENNILIKVVQDNLPTDYTTPPGIFTQCYISEP